MKTQLSNFQKEQYTQYLEQQLEKLSAFMVLQKKENQKHMQWTEIIQNQNQKIQMLGDKVLLLEIYQNQNLKHSKKQQQDKILPQQLQKKFNKLSRKLEDVIKGQHQQFNNLNNQLNNSNEQVKYEMQIFEKQMLKKIKNLQNKMNRFESVQENVSQSPSYRPISQQKFSPIPTSYSHVQSRLTSNSNPINNDSKKEIRKLQRRISTFLKDKFDKFQEQLSSRISQEKDTTSSRNYKIINNEKCQLTPKNSNSRNKKQKYANDQSQNIELQNMKSQKSTISVNKKSHENKSKSKSKKNQKKQKSIKKDKTKESSNLKQKQRKQTKNKQNHKQNSKFTSQNKQNQPNSLNISKHSQIKNKKKSQKNSNFILKDDQSLSASRSKSKSRKLDVSQNNDHSYHKKAKSRSRSRSISNCSDISKKKHKKCKHQNKDQAKEYKMYCAKDHS